jgi:hypothetical protein
MHLGIASLMSMRVGLVFLTTLPTYLVGKLILKSQVIFTFHRVKIMGTDLSNMSPISLFRKPLPN